MRTTAVFRERILITGASSGLGDAMARRWATPGRTLVLAARCRERLDALAGELSGAGERVVVNAGVGNGAPVGTRRADANERTVRTDVLGTFSEAEAPIAVFRRREHGHLVSPRRRPGCAACPAGTAHSASNAAVIALGQGLPAELVAARSPIRVTTVLPGFIATAINEVNRPPGIATASLEQGADALVAAIERCTAVVRALPWAIIARAMPFIPKQVLGRTG